MLERQQIGYRPGIGLFPELEELGSAKVYLRETALRFMKDLFEATRETRSTRGARRLDVVYAEKIHGHGGVDLPSRVGGRLPRSSTGMGNALLS